MDDFEDFTTGLTAPARAAEAIVPNDTGEIAHFTRAVYVGTTGDLAAVTLNGDAVTFRNLPAGSFLPVRLRKILATGTTAADIIALW